MGQILLILVCIVGGFFIIAALCIFIESVKFIWYKIRTKGLPYTEYGECVYAIIKLDKNKKPYWSIITKGSVIERKESGDKFKLILSAKSFSEGSLVRIYIPDKRGEKNV